MTDDERDAARKADMAFYRFTDDAERTVRALNAVGSRLFLAIVQQLVLPPKTLKAVEVAAKTWRKEVRWPPVSWKIDSHRAWIERFESLLKTAQRHAQVAATAIKEGKTHDEEGSTTQVKAGSFTLVNTAGFDTDIMRNVAEVVEDAERKVRAAGFGQVCYGNVIVANKLSGKTAVQAFYVNDSDEMFVRADKDSSDDKVRAVIHELGHRLHHVFHKNKTDKIERLYRTTKIRARYDVKRIPDEHLPEPGFKFRDGRKEYTVVSATPDEVRVLVNGREATVSAKHWMNFFGIIDPSGEGFVTHYASKAPDENFAELFLFYCLGKLSAQHKRDFEWIISG